jgi:hypothetical protein
MAKDAKRRLQAYLSARERGFSLQEAIELSGCRLDHAARLPELPPASAIAPLLHFASDLARRDYRRFGQALVAAGYPKIVVYLALRSCSHVHSCSRWPYMRFHCEEYERRRGWLEELRRYAGAV